MQILKLPLAIGFFLWTYLTTRLVITMVANSMGLDHIFGSVLISALLVVAGCALAFAWDGNNEEIAKKEKAKK